MGKNTILTLDLTVHTNDRRRRKRIKVIEFGKNGVPRLALDACLCSTYAKRRNTFSASEDGVVLELTPIIERYQEFLSVPRQLSDHYCTNWGYAIVFHDIKSIEKLIAQLNFCKKILIAEKIKEVESELKRMESISSDVKRYIALEKEANSLAASNVLS